ncbi:hypothetical protein FLJC2902T_07770 [Flavobacterium limnosediminis JC2902]|uniref:ATP-cone domain-containing protein n=1 Tax=Flavobacterium limnosediminis JC2902 TaxID=1341181 RepID=V6SY88_9FLAO|nr:ATP cone domain-containing protein [Flavobacterium limnosediminis]ESU29380.1 hypothetical protein FLJC2902T_07770 [Flavobacterium limnosediminis JC2902]
MKVVKQSGEIVYFDKEKLRRSLQDSGAKKERIDEILESIESEIYDGMPTRKIYKLAFQMLKKSSKVQAARYNLKSAIQLLGPAGFFFEEFIALLFASEGCQTKVNLILDGRCVSHELDVLIKKNNTVAMIECKFHSNNDVKSDVKIPMYILSRFNDLRENRYDLFTRNDQISECIVITNNRFTSEALQFGICSGLKMISWDYPSKESLKFRINQKGLFPLTCLTSLTQVEKEMLLSKKMLLARELIKGIDILNQMGINRNRIKNIIREASDLCD